mmetsp:Transcript_9274/g.22254  ORF Transcript_9274/g.22254 Transcript_9274/m.22254 type:complete len:346 (-) Transcript_9274:48-1085(-)
MALSWLEQGTSDMVLPSRLKLATLGLGGLLAGWSLWKFWNVWSRPKHVRITALYIYPVKGCRGHLVSKAKVTTWGLEGDRIYMIVNAKNEFVTQRELPRMALVHPDLPSASGITLRVGPESAQEQDPLLVPVRLDGPEKKVRVWEDWVPAIDQGEEAAKWLSSFLRCENLRLVRIAQTAQRTTDPKYGIGETAFSDGFPVLVTSQASIASVRKTVLRAGGPEVGIDRFRPNIHVDGCSAFQEDEMRSIALRGLVLPLVKPCSRCTVPGVDPSTGTRTKETGGVLTKILREQRSGRLRAKRAQLHKSFFNEAKRADDVYFGQNALVEFVDGTETDIFVGDAAAVAW